ncbi:hypothetical protein [Cognatilysobacter terrigena]|uniref:hypothetical protein n=1 Tax=Cognatilysobacter terrigena TaxID=2488749 RepID=UPI00105C6998|nr:hypothetical protein [Lysobacter terrigena]
MRLLFPTALVIAGASMFAAPAARAGDVIDPLLVPVVAAAAAQLPAAPADGTMLAPPVATDALDDLRGGTDVNIVNSNNKTIITNTSDVDGTVDNNVALNTISGGNMVGGGSFGNAAGLSTVIQNSGNNVLIQNSTVVSIQFAPMP